MTVWIVVAETQTKVGHLVWIEGVAKTEKGAQIIQAAALRIHGDNVKTTATPHEVRSA